MLKGDNMPKITQIDKELAVLKEQLDAHCKNNEENFSDIKSDIKEVKNETAAIKKSLDEFFNEADKRYASKLTEQLFYTILGAFIVSIIYYALKMIGIS